MFIFHDQATEAKIIAEAATVTNEEMLAAINETPFYLFPEGTQVKLSDLTPKDREDIKYEIAAERLGECIMHGPLSCDSVQHHRIWSRAAKRTQKHTKKQ